MNIFLLCLLNPLILLAQNPAADLIKRHQAQPDQYFGRSEMFGISLSNFKNFQTEWPLVTVRYRQDSQEMRFTYANEIAMEALKVGNFDFPDGAVFAKIGFIGEPDPAFTSSVVPSGAKRYQFMVRDKKKFAETDGWGYALFNGKGQTFPGEPRAVAMACAACHKVVSQRGFVFSQLVQFAPFSIATQKPRKKESEQLNKIAFADLPVKQLPEELRVWLPQSTRAVREVTGKMKENLFEGTLDEIRPSLIEESLRSRKPAILLSMDQVEFSFVVPHTTGKIFSNKCGEGRVHISYGLAVRNPMTAKKQAAVVLPPDRVIKTGQSCVEMITAQSDS